MGEQGVCLALDVGALLAGQPGILPLTDCIEGFAQMAQDMELVEQDGRRWCMVRVARRGAEGFPHIHHRQANFLALLRPQPLIELIHTRFRAVRTSEPDGPPSHQVAHHNPVGVPLFDRDLINADDLGTRRPCALELRSHILLLQLLDSMPVQLQLAGYGTGLEHWHSAAPRRTQSVWGTTGWWPARPAAPASPCGRSGTTPAEWGLPGRYACRHRTNPESNEACGRKTCDAHGHTSHRVFFPPTLERENADLRIPKDPPNSGPGTKPREAIRVLKSSGWTHPSPVPTFFR